MPEYVIGGMDPDFREEFYDAGRAMDSAGVKWAILSAFRDDCRRDLASGYKASARCSLHGGSVRTGGNLAEILARLSRLIRHRARLRLKISALSAEGGVSALVLSLMPFILLGGISLISPGYFSEVRHHPLVAPALIYAGLSSLIGNVIMYRMVNFKF